MSNKLDDRYVEYDLANSINVLTVEHGGTGINSYANANRILITKATGIPANPIRIEDSGWGIDSLGALASWDSNKGAFEARIQTAEAHIVNSAKHLPSGGTNSTFLRGDKTWQTLSSDASSIYTIDQFAHSNSNNVQDVLDDLDQAITSHTHSYAPISHTHSYAPISHTHSYAPITHTHSNLTATQISTTDQFTYSNSINVQDVLDDLDAAITSNKPAVGSLGSTKISEGTGTSKLRTFTLPSGTWNVLLLITYYISDSQLSGGNARIYVNSTNIGSIYPPGGTKNHLTTFSGGSFTVEFTSSGDYNASGSVKMVATRIS